MVAEMARFDLPEDEDQLELNMPWLKVVSKLSNSFNFHCTHQNFCHPNCYRRQMRATKRIMEATRHVSYLCKLRLPLGYEIGHWDYFSQGHCVHDLTNMGFIWWCYLPRKDLSLSLKDSVKCSTFCWQSELTVWIFLKEPRATIFFLFILKPLLPKRTNFLS